MRFHTDEDLKTLEAGKGEIDPAHIEIEDSDDNDGNDMHENGAPVNYSSEEEETSSDEDSEADPFKSSTEDICRNYQKWEGCL